MPNTIQARTDSNPRTADRRRDLRRHHLRKRHGNWLAINQLGDDGQPQDAYEEIIDDLINGGYILEDEADAMIERAVANYASLVRRKHKD